MLLLFHNVCISCKNHQLRLTIEVVKVEFDAEQCSLRLNGINRKENEHIKLGQHHTIELELNRPVHIHKENWDSVDLV